MRLGLIGYGAVAGQALRALTDGLARPLESIACLARPDGADRARALLDAGGERLARDRRVVGSMAEMLALSPSLVAEAAGHEALTTAGAAALSAGVDLLITSVGALASDEARRGLDMSARAGGARYLICPGAVGGFDILSAAKLSGLSEVAYISRKPPGAWRGTRAQTLINLDDCLAPQVFFRGDAGEAARQYPQNANVAATIALMGLGFEQTRVELIADPDVTRNVHEIRFRARCADVTLRIEGNPSPDNPKSSMTTGFALARQIIDMSEMDRRGA